MSGRMAAIVGYILGERWTDPPIAELTVTSDGYLLARLVGDVGANEFIGEAMLAGEHPEVELEGWHVLSRRP